MNHQVAVTHRSARLGEDSIHEDNERRLSQSRMPSVPNINQDSSEDALPSSDPLVDSERNEKVASVPTILNPDKRNSLLRTVQRFWRHSWVPEIVSYVLASVTFTGLVILLHLYQGKRLPEWPLGITINAMVSILTLVIKAGLALVLSEGLSQLKWQFFMVKDRVLMDMEDFDSASRGPWGSFQFLFKVENDGRKSETKRAWLRFMTWVLPRSHNLAIYFAKSAALLTLLVFILDPFTQQVLQFEYCSFIHPTIKADITRTNSYILDNTNVLGGAIDLRMAVAINTGLNNPPRADYGVYREEHQVAANANAAASLVETTCETGNCTFDLFSTLAMCHTCDDITTLIIKLPDTPPGKDIFTLPQDPQAAIATNISVGAFPSLTDDEDGNNGTDWRYFHALAYKRGKLLDQARNVFSLLTLNLGPFYYFNESVAISPSAVLCTISPCVRTYSSFMVNGTLRELEIKRVLMPVLVGNVTDGSYQLVTSSIPNGTGWIDCEAHSEPGPGLVKVAAENVDNTVPINSTHESQFPPIFYPEQCVWTYGMRSPSAIGAEAIRQMQNLQVASFPTAIYPDGVIRLEGVPEGTLTSTNLWRLGDASFNTTDKFMSDFADTITARIRAAGSDPGTGQVHVSATCIRVNWAWLSFLATTMALTLLFLAVLIIVHASEGTAKQNWKSSSLAVLFCSVDDRIRRSTTARQSRDDIFEVARVTRARLVENDNDGTATFVSGDGSG
ncbi:hypothetical protein B0O99DRAFT_673193 [Bisporella sp. PMI_857]|nr:hypothetical protein B0O99DRAFT_673193 [Bisporella sp. PMI_857]